MSETAVLKSSSGTFGAIADKFQEAENQTNNNASTETTTENNNAAVETSESSVNNNGEIVNGTTETTVAAPTTTPEINESTFSLGFDDEISPTTTQEAATQTQPQLNIDEVLSKFDKKEIAKKLGLSDFALEIDEHLARGGNAMDYLNAKAIDWDKVSDLDILKAEFSKKYSMLDADMQEHLFNKKYGINPVEDDEITQKEKLINQKIDAAQLRGEKKAEQAKFKLPEAKTQQEQSKEFVEWQQNLQRQQQESQKAKQYIESHPSTQNLIQSKRVAINLGEGVKPYNFNVDKPELIMKAIYDSNFWHKVISNEKGELDVERLQRVVKYAFNPDKHDKDLFNYGKSHGVQTLVSEGQNAKKPDGVSASPEVNNGTPKVTGTGKLGNHLRR